MLICCRDHVLLTTTRALKFELLAHDIDAQERERESADIARKAVTVREAMADLARLVADQDADIRAAEKNTEVAEERAKKGNEHLEGARKHQSSYRSKLLWFVVIVVLGAAAVTLYFVLRH